jgi:hypothetical protein
MPPTDLQPPMRAPAARGGFGGELVARSRARFWLKVTGITAYMWLFFEGYFHLLRHPTGPVVVMPLTWVDHWVGFQPWALWPYLSLWLYVSLPPGLLRSTRELLHYGVWVGALLVAGLACFWWWPTAVPHVPVETAYPGFALLRGVDAAGNACPSLHVAVATFSAAWLHRLLCDMRAPGWMRGLNAAWVLAIVWSTLAVKQHVWWDVLGGLALALLFAPASLAWRGPQGGGDIMAARGKAADGTP